MIPLQASLSDDLFSKKYASLAAFEEELRKYGLMDLDKECLAGSQESCFILKKIMEKEVKDFVHVARHFEKRRKTQEEEAAAEAAVNSELSSTVMKEWVAYKKKWFEWYMKKLDEQKLAKLKKMECKSTADVDGVKRYVSCRKGKLSKKYTRLKEKYPNVAKHGYVQPEESWLSHLRFLKKACLYWGCTDSCVALQKMRKQR